MATKANRWSLRVTPAQDAIVRRVLATTGESLNEYVVRHAVRAAEAELADQRVFALDDTAWEAFQTALSRPLADNPALQRLLREPSVLERSREQ